MYTEIQKKKMEIEETLRHCVSSKLVQSISQKCSVLWIVNRLIIINMRVMKYFTHVRILKIDASLNNETSQCFTSFFFFVFFGSWFMICHVLFHNRYAYEELFWENFHSVQLNTTNEIMCCGNFRQKDRLTPLGRFQ